MKMMLDIYYQGFATSAHLNLHFPTLLSMPFSSPNIIPHPHFIQFLQLVHRFLQMLFQDPHLVEFQK